MSHKAEHHVVFLVQWFLGDEAIVESQFRVSGNDAGRAESSLGDFGELAEEEEYRNGNTSARDCEVDELHVGERVDIVSGEESLGCDEGTNERRDAVPRLTELKTSLLEKVSGCEAATTIVQYTVLTDAEAG